MPKLLLIEDVQSLGRKGEIVSVKPGYARNFLVPKKYAVVADATTLKMQARLQDEREKKALADKKDAEEMAARLEGVSIETHVKVDHDGHMYGSVTAADIVRLLESQKAITLDKHAIGLKHAIKDTGVHTISLKLKEGVTASFTLNVISEEANANAVLG